MIFERVKSKVVAHISYFIGSQNEAVVVDPQRDCGVYIEIAQREGMRIRYVFETHRNEDYVIGSRELAHLTGGEIYHGPWPDFEYGETVEDGQKFFFGKLRVTAIQTPGHTPGCVSYAVADLDSGGETVLVCTGDTLFVGDVGRTDFGGPERREWSENLYDSIFNKLLHLGDHVVLCPAHGAGSVCGGRIADRELSTLGLERLTNPLLQMSREEFVEHKVEEHHEYAPYFRTMERYNIEGAPFVGYGPTPVALSPKEFHREIEREAFVVDTRTPTAFGGGHIEGSYSLPLTRLGLGGWVFPYDKPILLVLEDREHLDYVTRSLMRLGYDNVKGYLGGGIEAWYRAALPLEELSLLTVQGLKAGLDGGEDWTLLDVRSWDEWHRGHIEGAMNVYVGLLDGRVDEVPEDKPIAVICKAGTRASFASSILLRWERVGVHNVLGGMDAWTKAGYPVTK